MPGAAETVGTILSSAVRSVLSRWTALRLSVSYSDAHDPQAVADALLADTVTLCLSGKRAGTEAYELLFTDAFSQLGADIEDGSVEQVAARLVALHDAAVRGDLAPVRAEAERGESCAGAGESAFGQNRNDQSHDSDGDMRDDAEEAAPPRPTEPEVDEDGFTVVRRVTRSMTRAAAGGGGV